MNKIVHIIGAGLAGCEAAYQLAKLGIKVKLYEMKSFNPTPAQKSKLFAELVCSNSLKSSEITNACGLLKKELEIFESLLMKCADLARVPAGTALSVDREKFATLVTNEILENENIEIVEKEYDIIDIDVPTIIATGPLTSDKLCKSLQNLLGEEFLSFYDAASPIIYTDSIDMNFAYFADRYDKGTGDYLNCGLNKSDYENFVNELINAKVAVLKDFEVNVFEGCMPIEIMAKRGTNSLRYGPMKPIGLNNPITNEKYYAVLQLRKENKEATMFNLVGFQTNLIPAEQKRVFSKIKALENAEFARYGAMHKNIFINAPKSLNKFSQLKNFHNIFIAGQLSGVEGYVESIASGMACAINMFKYLSGQECIDFTTNTMIGSLLNYISSATSKNFQPMNSNYAIMQNLYSDIKDKNEKRILLAKKSLQILQDIKEGLQCLK